MFASIEKKTVTVDERRRELGRSGKKTRRHRVVPGGAVREQRPQHHGDGHVGLVIEDFKAVLRINAADLRYVMERVQADLHLPRGRPERAAAGKRRRAAASTLRLRLQMFLVDGRSASSLVHAYLCLLIRFIMGLAEATT
jgi:hypothetical protein